MIKRFFIAIFMAFSVAFSGEVVDFRIYKIAPTLSEALNEPVFLIMSGIQGDEPGAFNATSIFIKHYTIKNGNVWVIPTLNQHSIIKNNRGIYGDMNRKFDTLSELDPEYKIISDIKKLILDEKIGVILHLHDGSGFYRDRYVNNLINQNRWGNCSIIDQDTLFQSGDLNSSVSKMVDYINGYLLKELHRYHIRNTNTALGDPEQIKSLTYFATKNNKMAFANEASKNLPLRERVYYHLLAIEGMLKNFDIEFERNFDFNLSTIGSLINDKNMNIVINGSIELPLGAIKPNLNYFPLMRDSNEFSSNTPIVWLFKENDKFRIKNGNRGLTTLTPFFIDFDDSLKNVKVKVDGEIKEVEIGSVIKVKEKFEILNLPYRVNVIGFQGKNSEVDIEIRRRNLMGKFAIDKENTKFRVEFYTQDSAKDSAKKEKFAGMLIMDFSD